MSYLIGIASRASRVETFFVNYFQFLLAWQTMARISWFIFPKYLLMLVFSHRFCKHGGMGEAPENLMGRGVAHGKAWGELKMSKNTCDGVHLLVSLQIY